MYKQKLKEKSSSALANAVSQRKSNHTIGLTDNRPEAITQRKIVQAKGINFEAGTGNLWHVHKDHVKFNGDNGSRINFKGRSKAFIKKQMEAYHNTLPHNANTHHTYLQCRKWINKHL